MLLDAVRTGVALLTWSTDTFAYASAFDEGTGRYSGLVGGENAAVVLDAMSVLVKPEVASRQLDEERQRTAGPTVLAEQEAGTSPADEPSARGAIGSRPQAQPSTPKRFYGRVVVEPVRMLRDLGDIADAIVAQLSRADAEITITVEIEATAEEGFSEDVRRTVSENARTLKFATQEFEGE